MRQKNELFTHFQKFKSEVERTVGLHVWCLRSNGGKEHFSGAFASYLLQEGIRWEFTCRHTPQLNGVAEHKNGHILEVARAMLNEKHMRKPYWVEEANIVLYLVNRRTTFRVHDITRTRSTMERSQIYPMLLGIFGSIAYMHIPDEKRSKLDPTLQKCILMGYSLEQKCYKWFNPSTWKARVSRDVVFDESTSWYEPEPNPPEPSTNDLDNTKDDDQLRLIPEESLISTRLSRPINPPSHQSTSRLCLRMDKGKAKMPEYEYNQSDDNESTPSFDNEFGAFDVPLMVCRKPLPQQTKNFIAPPVRRI